MEEFIDVDYQNRPFWVSCRLRMFHYLDIILGYVDLNWSWGYSVLHDWFLFIVIIQL